MTILNQMQEDVDFLIKLIPMLKKEEQQPWIKRLHNLQAKINLDIIPEEYAPLRMKPFHYFSDQIEPSHTFFTAKKPRNTIPNQRNSHFTVLSDEGRPVMSFFMEHKKNKIYPKGFYALKVKKGFTNDDREPKYAVKVYKQERFPNSKRALRTAMRAALCYKKLGQTGIAFRNKGRQEEKQYLVTKWLDGVGLNEANPEQIQSMPIPQRIAMAISLMHQVDALHRLGIIFHDIKPENVMFDKETGTLFLMDLDAVRLKHEALFENETYCVTERYLSPQLRLALSKKPVDWHLKFDEQTDIYALGLTLMSLFGEIYTLKASMVPELRYFANMYLISPGKEYHKHSALQKLLIKMTPEEPDASMTMQQLLGEFKEVLSQYPGHEPYLAQDKLVDLTAHYTLQEGKKAFDKIERELCQYEPRKNLFKQQHELEKTDEAKEENAQQNQKKKPPSIRCGCSIM